MRDEKPSIIKAITSPLGFFVLSLLIVESFLAITLVFSNLNPENKFWGMIIGAVLFFLVVGAVCWLVKTAPENLTFGEKSHLEKEKLRGGDMAKGTTSVLKKENSIQKPTDSTLEQK